MKSAWVGMVAFVGGMVLFLGIGIVFEYVSIQNALSFALKNGIYQASKIAMIPEIMCELVENPDYVEPLDEQEEVPYYIEVCEEIFLTQEEYFILLQSSVLAYKQGPIEARLDLMSYQSEPFLARARLVGDVSSVYWKTEIMVEEMVIAH